VKKKSFGEEATVISEGLLGTLPGRAPRQVCPDELVVPTRGRDKRCITGLSFVLGFLERGGLMRFWGSMAHTRRGDWRRGDQG